MSSSAKLKERDMEALAIIVNLGYQNGWITENEQLQFNTKRKLNGKKQALFDIMQNMKCNENAAKLVAAIRCINEVTPSEDFGNLEDELSTIIASNLFKRGLITHEEYLIHESNRELKIRSATTEKVSAGKEDFSEPIEEDDVEDAVPIKNPMLLGPVIKSVLEHLCFDEIKKCRFISKEWSSVGLNILTTRSHIEFSQYTTWDGVGDGPWKTPVNFFQAYPSNPEEIVPFNSFSICGDDKNPWKIEELDYFFRKQQCHITELELRDLHLVDDHWRKLEDFDITHWISNLSMSKPNKKSKSIYLKIFSYPDNILTKPSMNLNATVNIKELYLMKCTVNIQDGVRIAPTSFEFSTVDFVKDGNTLPELCVNDIVDLSMVKNISLVCSEENDGTKLSLDLTQKKRLKINRLILANITLRNFRSWNCSINSMTTGGIPFTEKTAIEVKALQINSAVNLSALPQSLEKLDIHGISNQTCTCTSPILLLNLKFLNMTLLSNCCSLIFQNMKFPNLVNLCLQNISNTKTPIDLSWIPESLNILKLARINITNERNKTLRLERLILESYLPCQAQKICSMNIHTKEIVLSFRRDAIETDRIFLNFLQDQKSHHESGQRIYAGCFDWERIGEPFDESALSTFVDREAHYYVFENNRGRAIDFIKFQTLMVFNTDEDNDE